MDVSPDKIFKAPLVAVRITDEFEDADFGKNCGKRYIVFRNTV